MVLMFAHSAFWNDESLFISILGGDPAVRAFRADEQNVAL